MTNYQLQYFVSACELKSFTKAAHKHFVSQAAVSQQISALESELNTMLFIRANRSIRVTEAGAVFYRYAKNAIGQLDRAAREISLADHQYSGHIRIGYGGLAEAPFLSESLRTARKHFSELYIELVKETTMPETVAQLRAGELDGAFLMCSEEKIPGIVSFPLLRYPLGVYVGRDHAWYNREIIYESELAGQCILRPPLDREDRDPKRLPAHIIDGNQEAQPDMLRTDILEFTDHIDSLFFLVEAGYGIAMFPKYFDYKLSRNSAIRSISYEHPYVDNKVLSFAYLENSDNPLLPAYLEIVKQSLPDESDASL